MPKKKSKPSEAVLDNVNLDGYFGEIIGQEWGMGGILNITSLAWAATYETKEDAIVAEYEFRYLKRRTFHANEPCPQGYIVRTSEPTLYIKRDGGETPSPEILEVLNRAKNWKPISFACPYLW